MSAWLQKFTDSQRKAVLSRPLVPVAPDLTGEDYTDGLRLMVDAKSAARLEWQEAAKLLDYIDRLKMESSK